MWQLVSNHNNNFRTLQTNNLTTLSSEVVSQLPRLQSLRLENNHLLCDCQLNWILDHETLAPLARCSAPYSLSGRRIVELKKKQLKCAGNNSLIHYLTNYSVSSWVNLAQAQFFANILQVINIWHFSLGKAIWNVLLICHNLVYQDHCKCYFSPRSSWAYPQLHCRCW